MQHAQKLSDILEKVAPLQAQKREMQETLLAALESTAGGTISVAGMTFESVESTRRPGITQKSCKGLLQEFVDENTNDVFDIEEFMKYVKKTLKAKSKIVKRLKITKE
jgi:hypothetical protein